MLYCIQVFVSHQAYFMKNILSNLSLNQRKVAIKTTTNKKPFSNFINKLHLIEMN